MLRRRVEDVHPVIHLAHHMAQPSRSSTRITLDYELGLVIKGSYDIHDASDRCLTATEGDLFWITPFVPHTPASRPGQPFEHIAFHFDLTQGTSGPGIDLATRPPFRVQLENGPELPELAVFKAPPRLLGLFYEFPLITQPLQGIEAFFNTVRLMQILGSVFRHLGHSDSGPSRSSLARRLAPALVLAQQRFAEKLYIEDLAQPTGWSVSRFSHVFVQTMGVTPLQYIQQLRLQHAKGLLREPGMGIKQIAARCGFDNAFHFSTAFRSHQGLTPSAYRAKMLLEASP